MSRLCLSDVQMVYKRIYSSSLIIEFCLRLMASSSSIGTYLQLLLHACLSSRVLSCIIMVCVLYHRWYVPIILWYAIGKLVHQVRLGDVLIDLAMRHGKRRYNRYQLMLWGQGRPPTPSPQDPVCSKATKHVFLQPIRGTIRSTTFSVDQFAVTLITSTSLTRL